LKPGEVKTDAEHTAKANGSKIPRNVIVNKSVKANNQMKPATNISRSVQNNTKKPLTNSTSSSQILTPAMLNPTIENNLNLPKVEYFEVNNNYPDPDLKVVNNLKLPTAFIQ